MQNINYCPSCQKAFTDLTIVFCPFDATKLVEMQDVQSSLSTAQTTASKNLKDSSTEKSQRVIPSVSKKTTVPSYFQRFNAMKLDKSPLGRLKFGCFLFLIGLCVMLLFLAILIPISESNKKANTPSSTPSVSLSKNSQSISSPAAPPSSTSNNLDSPEVRVRIKKGKQIYDKIASRTGLPTMFGWRAQKMSLLIPTGNWKTLTKEDQINLTYFAENLVKDIRQNPEPYAQKWANYYKRTEQLESGGEYDGLYKSSYLEQIENLCDTCWDITIGQAKRDGFYDDEIPVTGSSVQSFRENAK